MKIKKYFTVWVLAIALGIIMLVGMNPAVAQLPLLPRISLDTFKLDRNLSDEVISACVRLEGRCVFELSDQKSDLKRRINYTEERLAEIKQLYLQDKDSSLQVVAQADSNNQQTIYVDLGTTKLPVLSLNNRDANIHGVTLEHHAQQKADKIQRGLIRTKQERESAFLWQQAKVAVSIILLILLVQILVSFRLNRLRQEKRILTTNSDEESLTNALNQRKIFNLKEVQFRLLQLIQTTVLLGGSLIILGLFPQTRLWQLWIITLIRIPLRLAIVILVCYILVRLSYAAIARINTAITNNTFANSYVFQPDSSRRLQLRMNTFSRLFRGIITCFWAVVGLFVALSILGLNVAPLLAGAGVLGLAFSFASQNLIKDTINGLLIIFEDQYAVGDVVTIGEVGGMVETLNLRITQLRDGEGRLITIPNSAVITVANHSNGWSRSDLKIPFAYQTNVDRALKIISQVADEMFEDCDCREKILEPPQILGVEDFSERGYIVRLWFKTEPLKQWEVAREFRRRMRNAFEEAGIDLPLPQQQIWLNRNHQRN